jgi:hypothetical protein
MITLRNLIITLTFFWALIVLPVLAVVVACIAVYSHFSSKSCMMGIIVGSVFLVIGFYCSIKITFFGAAVISIAALSQGFVFACSAAAVTTIGAEALPRLKERFKK